MAISNVSSLYYRIHRGAEGAMEFARVLDKLLISESQSNNESYIAYSDRAVDYKGVDGILIKGHYKIAFQYKFFDYLLDNHINIPKLIGIGIYYTSNIQYSENQHNFINLRII